MEKEKLLEAMSRRMQDVMYEKRLSRKSMIEATGATAATVSQWVHGNYEPCLVNLMLIAKFLGVSETWLLNGDPNMKKIPNPNDWMNDINARLAKIEKFVL